MSVSIHTTHKDEAKSHLAIEAETKSATTDDFWNMTETYRFGIIGLLLVLVTCLGGVAVAYALDKSMYHFTIAALPAILVESLMLGVASMRSIVIASVISCIVSILVMIF